MSSQDRQSVLQWEPLITGEGWEVTPPSFDPYTAQRQERVLCAVSDYGQEYGGIEVSTQRCGYITLQQPLLTSIVEGDLISLEIWHSLLVSDEESEGVVEISLRGAPLWSETLLIPSPPYSWSIKLESPISAERGELLLFHIHNHGANSYTLHSLAVAR